MELTLEFGLRHPRLAEQLRDQGIHITRSLAVKIEAMRQSAQCLFIEDCITKEKYDEVCSRIGDLIVEECIEQIRRMN